MVWFSAAVAYQLQGLTSRFKVYIQSSSAFFGCNKWLFELLLPSKHSGQASLTSDNNKGFSAGASQWIFFLTLCGKYQQISSV